MTIPHFDSVLKISCRNFFLIQYQNLTTISDNLFSTHTFYFLLTDLIHHKATLESDEQTNFAMLTLTDNAFLTDTIKRDNNKYDISSSLGTVNFLLGTIFDLAFTKFVLLISFLHNPT